MLSERSLPLSDPYPGRKISIGVYKCFGKGVLKVSFTPIVNLSLISYHASAPPHRTAICYPVGICCLPMGVRCGRWHRPQSGYREGQIHMIGVCMLTRTPEMVCAFPHPHRSLPPKRLRFSRNRFQTVIIRYVFHAVNATPANAT